MIDALYISASGLRSEQKQIDVISNNVANMQTPGFKRARVNFVDVVGAATSLGESATASGPGGGTRISSTSTMFSPGELRSTRAPLDVAIDGEGFFELQAADGSLRYTRDGQFRLDADGYLISHQGLRPTVEIQVPVEASDLKIGEEGEVSVQLPGEPERTILGSIELARFGAPDELTAMGNNLFAAGDAAGAPLYGRPGEVGFGSLRQGFVEMANVEMIDEMSALVFAQRSYQMNARVLQAADQVLETINNLRR